MSQIIPLDLDTTQMVARMTALTTDGIDTIQVGVALWYVNPVQGSWNLSETDTVLARAAQLGLRVNLHVIGVPAWAQPDLAGQSDAIKHWTLPRDAAELAAFADGCAYLVNRYPEVARIEVWNEPNLPEFSKPSVSPNAYAACLAAAYTAVKAARPGVTVVSAGLSRCDVGFGQAVIQALDALPGAAANRGYFDEFGVHPYSDADSPDRHDPAKVTTGAYGVHNSNFSSGITAILAMLDANGHAGKRLWLGEYGFSTTTTWMPAVPDHRRGWYAVAALIATAGNPRVSALNWYGLLPSIGVPAEWAIIAGDGTPSATYRSIAAWHQGQVAQVPFTPPATVTGDWTVTAPGGVAASRTEVWVDELLAASELGVSATVNTAAIGAGAHTARAVWFDTDGVVLAHTPIVPVTIEVGTWALRSTTPAITNTGGGVWRAEATLSASPGVTVDYAVIACRDTTTGAEFDFPGSNSLAVTPGGTVQSSTRPMPGGSYRAWAAVNQGGTWSNLTAEVTFTV